MESEKKRFNTVKPLHIQLKAFFAISWLEAAE